ncbi:TerC/Alx family metal homeostasis membrane protein [uncultured Clostridium sp.]|uniref:TerC/Alx family metal homeostasis membrane protein n=1 Tax=uncultured Clostridium sp. TaxID=59620 RepID=UPI002600789F|nr:TerC/Alx family metal homeostasis membrane protein [uncultured Clostridium sp.]MDU4882268.1 TerC/Alx family metal homeostasis membrane protein [Clostridium celatum]MDU7075538.1 TerC/Alx family metal homeostasis membrane protein [Clostridium celatum]
MRRTNLRAKSALRNFITWASLAFIVNVFIYFIFGADYGLEFLGGYIIELSLSVDNLFLFLIIFTSFNIPISYQKRVLTYGIIGAIILRFIFIFLGVAIINKFNWILYIFGFFLFFSGLKILLNKEEEVDFSKSKILNIMKHFIPVTNELNKENFFVKINGVLHATPLLLILVLIESSDIIFALDSIPAIFSITTNPYIVYSSNIFAILGLRSMYFLLAKLNSMFNHIKYGVAFILMFTGIKLFIAFWGINISTVVSLLVIAIILLSSVLFSLIRSN